jgi:hypothetical protein
VGFIHQHDDIFAFVQHAIGFAKFENGGDDDFARVLFEQGFEFGAGFGFDQVGDVGGVEGGADLRVEVERSTTMMTVGLRSARLPCAVFARRRPSAGICPSLENAR